MLLAIALRDFVFIMLCLTSKGIKNWGSIKARELTSDTVVSFEGRMELRKETTEKLSGNYTLKARAGSLARVFQSMQDAKISKKREDKQSKLRACGEYLTIRAHNRKIGHQ